MQTAETSRFSSAGIPLSRRRCRGSNRLRSYKVTESAKSEIHSQRSRLSSESSAEFVKPSHYSGRARLVPDLSCKLLDPTSAIEGLPRRIRTFGGERTCWIVGRSRSLPLTQLRQCIFPACVKDQTHATTFRKLQPRAALTEKPCADVLFWNLDASSGLGGVRHGICHAMFLYSKHVDAAPNA
jgi:hypothetical protein